MLTLIDRLQTCLEGRYRVRSLVREGGTTLRFEARAIPTDRPILIDVVRPDVADAIGPATLLTELRRAAHIEARGMDPVVEVGECPGLLFVATEPPAGTLRERLEKQGALSPAAVALIVRDLAHALDGLHAKGEVYGHLSASRVVLEGDSAGLRPYALARLVTLAAERAATGHVVGALGTLAPEQIRRESPTRASDVYALAGLAFEMLTGQPPFGHGPDEIVAGRKLTEEAPSPAALRGGVPPRLDEIVRQGLAREPAGRPLSAGDFAVELKRATMGPDLTRPFRVSAPAPAALVRTPHRRRTAIALGAAILATTALVFVWILRDRAPEPHGASSDTQPVGLLVADFDGPPGDPGLAQGFRRMLAAHLDETGRFRTVPDRRMDDALARAGLPESTHVTAARAFELADRTTVRGVITGTVQPLGQRLSVIVQAYLAEDGDARPLATLAREVRNEDELVPLARRMADELVKKLGPMGSQLRAHRIEDRVETHSYQAYQALVRAGERSDWGDFESALEFAREAMRLDPDCVEAEIAVGQAFERMGESDSARVHWERALVRKGRLPLERQWELAASLARLNGSDPEALAFYDRVLDGNPDDLDARIDRADTWMALGHAAEARNDYEYAARLTPLGPGRALGLALFRTELAVGDVNAARARAARFDSAGAAGLLAQAQLAFYEERWGAARAFAERAASDPACRRDERQHARATLAAAYAAQGDLAAAGTAWRAAVRPEAGDGPDPPRAGWIARGGVYAWALGDPALVAGAPRPEGDASCACLGRASLAIARGDLATARTEAKKLRAQAAAARPGAVDAASFADAWLGLCDADAALAITQLSPRAVGPNRRLDDGGGLRPAVLLVLGDAYVRAAQVDSARRCYEAILDPKKDSDLESNARAWLFLPVRARLARLEEQSGDVGRAREHCEAIERALAPDADRRLKLEARALRARLFGPPPGVMGASRTAS